MCCSNQAALAVASRHRTVAIRPPARVCCVALSPRRHRREHCLRFAHPSSIPRSTACTHPFLNPPYPASNAQIKEEFSNGISPGRPASPAGGLPRPSPPGVVTPGRPLHAGDSGRERALRPSGLNGNHDASPAVVGRAVAGGGGGRVARAAVVAANKAKERAAEADDRKRAVARKKEVRGEEYQEGIVSSTW